VQAKCRWAVLALVGPPIERRGSRYGRCNDAIGALKRRAVYGAQECREQYIDHEVVGNGSTARVVLNNRGFTTHTEKLMFEHHWERRVSRRRFAVRMLRRLLVSATIIARSLAVGITG